ncbi:MAG: Lsm family RNA-binding protein [Candidatus Geothermarchaeales archaeon]
MFAIEAFKREVTVFINEEVTIETVAGESITGTLKAYDPGNLSIILEDAIIGGEEFKRLMINGSHVSKIYLKEKRVDLEKLKERLEERFPRLVDYKKELGVILVMNRIRVTEKGVDGDPGPATDRVKKIFDKFMEETGLSKHA